MRTVHRLLIAAAALSLSAWAYGETTSFEREVNADPHGTVEISATNGTIDVTGWDKAAVAVKADLGSDVDHVEVTSSGNHTVVRVVPRSHVSLGLGFSHDETHLRVQVPRESALEASTVSGNVTSAGVLGTQRLGAVSGDIAAEIGPADIEAKSVSGNVKLRGHGQPARLHVSSVSGDVELKHAAGELETHTVSGEITVELDPARAVHARSTSGDITFEGRLMHGADFDAQSVSGDLKLRASSEDGFEYEAQTLSGEISNCFNVEAERSSRYGPGRKLSGTRGAGGAHVRLKSMSGDLEMCDH
jgi:DUF4097 and DUF4098 domain-containing protein YvlB